MGRRGVARGLLALAIALAVAGVTVVIARSRPHATKLADPVPAYMDALVRGDYRAAFRLTDLDGFVVRGPASALTLAHYTAYERARPITSWRRLSGNEVELLYRNRPRSRTTIEVQGTTVIVPVSTLVLTAATGPLPSVSIDGVRTLVRAVSSKANAVGTVSYRYAIAVIRGEHRVAVAEGYVTAARGFGVDARSETADVSVVLSLSQVGIRRAAIALHGVVGTCPGDSCVVAPCTGSGTDYVLDASGIGTPFISSRVLVGDEILAPMPAGGWSIAVTFVDLGQPPGLSGKEQTKTIRARFVFGFVRGRKAQLLDRCWLPNG